MSRNDSIEGMLLITAGPKTAGSAPYLCKGDCAQMGTKHKGLDIQARAARVNSKAASNCKSTWRHRHNVLKHMSLEDNGEVVDSTSLCGSDDTPQAMAKSY